MLIGRSKHTSLSLSMESRTLSGVKSRLISVRGHSAGLGVGGDVRSYSNTGNIREGINRMEEQKKKAKSHASVEYHVFAGAMGQCF